MENFEDASGEFFVAGRAARADDPTFIATASVGKHDSERYVLFEFGIDEAIWTAHEDDESVRRRWRTTWLAPGGDGPGSWETCRAFTRAFHQAIPRAFSRAFIIALPGTKRTRRSAR